MRGRLQGKGNHTGTGAVSSQVQCCILIPRRSLLPQTSTATQGLPITAGNQQDACVQHGRRQCAPWGLLQQVWSPELEPCSHRPHVFTTDFEEPPSSLPATPALAADAVPGHHLPVLVVIQVPQVAAHLHVPLKDKSKPQTMPPGPSLRQHKAELGPAPAEPTPGLPLPRPLPRRTHVLHGPGPVVRVDLVAELRAEEQRVRVGRVRGRVKGAAAPHAPWTSW